MKILATFPGKYGDSIWAMPTIRALAEVHGPVDLLMAPAYSGICDLYRQQPYIGRAEAWPSWQVQNSAPMTPWSPFEETLHHEALDLDPTAYDAVLHLGYREWPTAPLPFYVYGLVRDHYPTISMAPMDLSKPWITIKDYVLKFPPTVTIGFSDEWFELKFGIANLLSDFNPSVITAKNSRWDTEGSDKGHDLVHIETAGWMKSAEFFEASEVCLACCSALHVLALAVGTPVVAVEPNRDRWNDIFWPFGMDGPQVWCVKGGDGLPTFDARHTKDTLLRVLDRLRTGATL